MNIARFAAASASFVLLCGSVVLPACGSSQVRQTETGVMTGPGALLTVEGLGCPMCAESIHVLLDDVEGVADSEVNLETGVVDVTFLPRASVSRAALASAVTDGGFSLRDIQPKE